jgi:pantothenate kinase type III
MLLAIDISNTNIKFGLYAGETLQHHWVVSTVRQRTTDEYAMLLSDLARHEGHRLTDIHDIIMSSVVPPLTPVFQELAQRYCGKEGAIAPGLLISAEALSSAASRLFLVDLTPPLAALGKNTIDNMQSGIIFGHVGLVQGLIGRLRKEIPGITDEREVKVIAHGGLSPLMAPIIPEIQHVNQFLALEGLRMAYTKLRE